MKTLLLATFVLVALLEVRVRAQLPVNPEPPGPPEVPPPPAENNYEAPVLQGGLGTVTDDKEAEAKRRRYPNRSGSYSQAYDPGLAFR